MSPRGAQRQDGLIDRQSQSNSDSDRLWNVQLSDVIVCLILVSDHLWVVFHILDPVRARNFPNRTEKLTDWRRFQSFASDLISPRIQINSVEEADRATHELTSSVDSAYKAVQEQGQYFWPK